MKPVRFIMIGGFLGAGKTTTISRLAKLLMARNLRVGIVTNDQAQDLVDTNNLKAQGLTVQEVPGACFCCKFNELVDRAGQLSSDNAPDVILAEPVGSCTDLVSTVILPLKDLHRGQYTVAPFPVIFKPSHGLRILRNESAGFSPKAAYIFRKQLEEADSILMNRIDELAPADREALQTLLATEYPDTTVFEISAKTGDGFEPLLDYLLNTNRTQERVLDIDYDVYAEGEAELGWLNCTFELMAANEFDLDSLLRELIQTMTQELRERQAEIAHLKLIGLEPGGAFAVANAVSNQETGDLSVSSYAKLKQVQLIVNARVGYDPLELQTIIKKVVQERANQQQLQMQQIHSQQLRPGRPTPTHRYPAPN